MIKLVVCSTLMLVASSCVTRGFNSSSQSAAQPTETYTNQQQCEWQHEATEIFPAWQMLADKYGVSPEQAAGKGVRVGVLDTGVLRFPRRHPELEGANILWDLGYNFVENNNLPHPIISPKDKVWFHGTNMSAMIASPRGKHPDTAGNLGVTGYAPAVEILPIRAVPDTVLNRMLAQRSASLTDELARAIVYATDNGVQVISLSLGTMFHKQQDTPWKKQPGYDPKNPKDPRHPSLTQALEYADTNGVIIVAPIGNKVPYTDGPSRGIGHFPFYPATDSHVIGVAGATMSSFNKKWEETERGFIVWNKNKSFEDWKPWPETIESKEALVSVPATTCYAEVERDSKRMPVDGPNQPVQGFVWQDSSSSQATTAGSSIAALWVSYHGYDNLVKRCGKANIRRAFAETIRNYGHVRPNGWETSKYGVGVINAKKALEAPLPSFCNAGN